MPEVMVELGLESGQTASLALIKAILQAQIGPLQAKIAMDKLKD